jgi:hypothetical protein
MDILHASVGNDVEKIGITPLYFFFISPSAKIELLREEVHVLAVEKQIFAVLTEK